MADPVRSIKKLLRFAWLEFQDTRDGLVFSHVASTDLGFENAFSMLPRGKSRSLKTASNAPDIVTMAKVKKIAVFRFIIFDRVGPESAARNMPRSDCAISPVALPG